MSFLMKKTKGGLPVELLPIGAIVPSPHQTRRDFDERELAALARSIDRAGLINPISVRLSAAGEFTLIAGERRLRACRLLGWTEIPAVLWDRDEGAAALLTLSENRERSDLHYLEEAEGILRFLAASGLSQSEGAAMLSMSQPALSNKLRLLRLPASAQEELRRCGIPERVARALLTLSDEDLMLRVLRRVAEGGLNVRQAEELVRETAEGQRQSRPYHAFLRDYRILFTTVDRAVEEIRKTGVRVSTERREEEDCIRYTIRIPKAARTHRPQDGQLSLYREAAVG